MSRVLVCDSSYEGIMSALYVAFENYKDVEHILPQKSYTPDFFSVYEEVDNDAYHSEIFSGRICRQISPAVRSMVFKASLHFCADRGDIIFEFLKLGFEVGKEVSGCLYDSRVTDFMDLVRKVENEAALFKGFVRFSELSGKVLYSKIEPKCDVLVMISAHFEKRFPGENFIIYDAVRDYSVVHPAGKKSFLMYGGDPATDSKSPAFKDGYENLWRTFFKAVTIEERRNIRCQNSNIPKWYRKNMPEFIEKIN